jgi:hypothetical protein
LADMMRSASARIVESDFDPGLPQLWSNFRRFGFCISSDFSSLKVGVVSSTDFFVNVPVPPNQVTAASRHLSEF